MAGHNAIKCEHGFDLCRETVAEIDRMRGERDELRVLIEGLRDECNALQKTLEAVRDLIPR